jgi:hypothetical protein
MIRTLRQQIEEGRRKKDREKMNIKNRKRRERREEIK